MIETMKALRRRDPRRAFTLVEVLASLALVAIILPVVMKGISLATMMAGTAKHRVEAASLAEAKLAELLATDGWQNGNLAGDFGSDRPDYRWTAEAQDWEGIALQQLDVHVTWTMRGKERSFTLTTLAYAGNE